MEKEKEKNTWKRHIPNILSAIRLLMVGVFIIFFRQGKNVAALGVYVTAMLTDVLDGYLARHNEWITDLGKVLDPLADKFMLITALVCFYTRGWIPLWLLVVVACKELLLILGGAFLWRYRVVVFADIVGKTATGFFNVGVIATLLKGLLWWIGKWNVILLVIGMVLTVAALVHYTRKNVYARLKSGELEMKEKREKRRA